MESTKHKEIELHSEEVQEVLGKVPSWIVRWGISLILAIIVILLVGSYFVEYPNSIQLEMTLVNDHTILENRDEPLGFDRRLIGEALLPTSQIRKVKIGQEVIVCFSNYSEVENEFGVVKGVVLSISNSPVKGYYKMKISFPNGFITNYKKKLSIPVGMDAKIDVITDTSSLLNRLLNHSVHDKDNVNQ